MKKILKKLRDKCLLNAFRDIVKSELNNTRLELEVNISKFISSALINQSTFSPFKNFCKGKKVVICGAGPSLQNYSPIKDAVHIALNRSFLFEKVQFDFIFAQDYEGVMMVKDELRDYRKENCVKLFGKLFRDNSDVRTNFPESFILECKAKTFATDAFFSPSDLFAHPFVAEIDTRAISCGTNVAMAAMQFALYMNPAEIYIVGCDHSGGHFSNLNESETEIKASDKFLYENWKNNLNMIRQQWMNLRQFAQVYYPETKIISVNPVGLRGIFTDLEQSTNTILENEIPELKRLYTNFIDQRKS